MRLHIYHLGKKAFDAAELPPRIKILDWGCSTDVLGKRSPVVSERTAELLPLSQASHGWDTICLDFEHNTCPGSAEYERTSEPRPVAARGGMVEVVPGDGLYCSSLVYTALGQERAEHYDDLSPALLLDEQDHVIGVHSVALTRAGRIAGLHYFSVELPDGPAASQDKKTGPAQPARKQEADMDLEALSKEIAALKAEVAALQAKLGDSVAQIEQMSASTATKLEALSASADKRFEARERASIVEKAQSEGKVVALSVAAQAKLTVEELEGYCAALPVTVPVQRRTPGREPLGAGASLIEQYNAIEEPAKRAAFFRENQKKLAG